MLIHWGTLHCGLAILGGAKIGVLFLWPFRRAADRSRSFAARACEEAYVCVRARHEAQPNEHWAMGVRPPRVDVHRLLRLVLAFLRRRGAFTDESHLLPPAASWSSAGRPAQFDSISILSRSQQTKMLADMPERTLFTECPSFFRHCPVKSLIIYMFIYVHHSSGPGHPRLGALAFFEGFFAEAGLFNACLIWVILDRQRASN